MLAQHVGSSWRATPLVLLAVLAVSLGCLKAGADTEITITIPFVRGNPDPAVITEVPVYVETNDEFYVYSGTFGLGFDASRLTLLDVEPVGLPAMMWLWVEEEGEVTVTFAGIEGFLLSGHILNLIFSWREGSGCAYVVARRWGFNEEYGGGDIADHRFSHGGVCVAGEPDPVGEVDGMRESGDLARPRLLVTNPYRVGSAIALFAPEAHQAVDVVLYAADGREVRTLHTGRVGSRGTTLTWDGRTDAGREAAAGIYYVLAGSGQKPQTARLLLIR
jgi:hypothetical protein